MNIFIRLYNRFIREFFRISNLLYLKEYKKELKNRININTRNLEIRGNIQEHIPKFLCESKYTREKTLIIHIPYGGLGDHLFYSHIPRIAKQSGEYNKVLLSRKSAIRNSIHLNYIWSKNPYFDGFTDLENLHDYNDSKISCFDETKGNILDQIMLSYGLDDNIRWHEPELYFEIPYFPELSEKFLYDPNFISYSGGLSSKKIENYFFKNNFKIDLQFSARSSLALPVINFEQTIVDNTFEEYCGILASCKKLISLTTGTATLAAALRKPTIVIHGNMIETYFLHSKNHIYVNL